MKLAEQLEEAQARVAQIERQIASATCREVGAHDWQSLGGCNAGCHEACGCSVPVYTCSRCGDCDYGDNEEAKQIRSECRQLAGLDDATIEV